MTKRIDQEFLEEIQLLGRTYWRQELDKAKHIFNEPEPIREPTLKNVASKQETERHKNIQFLDNTKMTKLRLMRMMAQAASGELVKDLGAEEEAKEMEVVKQQMFEEAKEELKKIKDE